MGSLRSLGKAKFSSAIWSRLASVILDMFPDEQSNCQFARAITVAPVCFAVFPRPVFPAKRQGRRTSAGVGARLWSEPPACHAAIPGGILSAGRCPQESGHGRPEAHSTGANQGVSPTIGVFHEIPRAAAALSNRPGGPPHLSVLHSSEGGSMR